MHEGEQLTTCSKRGLAYDLTADEALLRHGLGVRRFSDVVSSEEKPIEVCGASGEVRWLTRVTCNDGSRPWGRDVHKAHAERHTLDVPFSRTGECRKDRIIDHYRVPCPEKAYDVYMFMYECGPGEEMIPRR